jgi:hypothetical protein
LQERGAGHGRKESLKKQQKAGQFFDLAETMEEWGRNITSIQANTRAILPRDSIPQTASPSPVVP